MKALYLKQDLWSFHFMSISLMIVLLFLGANTSIATDNKHDMDGTKSMVMNHAENSGTEQITPESGHDHQKMMDAQVEEAAVLISSVGVVEKLGQKVDLEATFTDENGKVLQLKELIDRPTIILPIFFHCPVVCPLLLASLAEGVKEVPFEAGKDYRIIALSFNDEENATVAKNAKDNYLHLLPDTFDKEYWNFLTGEELEIRKFTDSFGFSFKKTAKDTFVHPNSLIVTDEHGTIIRYLYGTTFLGGDMGMAIAEAQNNSPGTSIKRIISICFNYDSEGKVYISLLFRVLATLTILGLGVFFVFFLLKKDKKSQNEPKEK